MTTTDQTPAAAPQPIGPGAIAIGGQTVEYALGRSGGDQVRLWIVGVFAPGDERARVDIVAVKGQPPLTQDFADEKVYRRVVAFAAECAEAAVVVPDRIGSWLRGMTAADVAKEVAAQHAAATGELAPGVISLEQRRRARAGG